MYLLQIKAKNYRTLSDLHLDFSRGYSTLSGRNNAGKSSVIRILNNLFLAGRDFRWRYSGLAFDYKADRTQWVKGMESIDVSVTLELTRADDPALVSFVEKIASTQITGAAVTLSIGYSLSSAEGTSITAIVGDQKVDDKAAKEIEKRIKDSNLLFLYNSTTRHEEILFGPGRRRLFYEFVMSAEERKAMADASKQVERRIRKLAKEHTTELSRMLGRLTDKYDVEASPIEGLAAQEMPLGLNLRDRNVEVPLDDWGSGTQNRTHILMAILQANRIKTTGPVDERITPIVVVEEPESFLHPSAQAEFGRLLRYLSRELGIQILVTTHSPHMLNQEEPTANILLARALKRGKAYETTQVRTDGDQWMTPFADHLGITAGDFADVRPLFGAAISRVLLVEGALDEEYFRFMQKHKLDCEQLDGEIEIVPYGGKDTLKNTLLLQFVLRKFDRVFITFDLDAHGEVTPALTRLGLQASRDYWPLGQSGGGKDCFEGLLPQSVLQAVNGRETDNVMALGSKDTTQRRRAKEALKRAYLAEFRSRDNYSRDELKELGKAVRAINGRLAKR